MVGWVTTSLKGISKMREMIFHKIEDWCFRWIASSAKSSLNLCPHQHHQLLKKILVNGFENKNISKHWTPPPSLAESGLLESDKNLCNAFATDNGSRHDWHESKQNHFLLRNATSCYYCFVFVMDRKANCGMEDMPFARFEPLSK